MRVLILSILCVLGLAAQDPKIVYFRLLTPFDEQKEFYVGEKIELKYSLLLFSGASLLDVEFIPSKNPALAQGVEVLNPASSWEKQEDDSYENTFIYKIKSENFALPDLKVLAISQDGRYIDSDLIKGKRFEAIPLAMEGYSGVVAKSLIVSDVRAKKYDEWSNIVTFNLEAQSGNLEDFKLEDIDKQGFYGELISNDFGQTSGAYYVVFPSNSREIKFNFFSLETLRYEEKVLSIAILDDRVSTQTDLKPKNNFLIFSNILFAFLVLCLCIAGIYFRKKKFWRWILPTLAFVLFVILIYRLFVLKEVVLKTNSVITILPTQNSTPMQTILMPVVVEVIGEHNEFYKIKFDDSKIGWVRKNDCQ